MKYLGDVNNLQELTQKTAHKSIKPIVVNLLPHIDVDSEKTLVLEDINSSTKYKLDSNIAYTIANHYMGIGIMLEQIEDNTNQKPKKKYVDDFLVGLSKKDNGQTFASILIEEKKMHGMIEEPKEFHLKLNIEGTNVEEEQYAKVGL